jgi:SAM-dependent methyltransferase
MNISDIISRDPRPVPWAEGEKIPWNEPGFSARMLREHLSQGHDAASRRSAIIDRQVDWIFQAVLAGSPSRVLDLGCGPGLYTSRLAERGCRCTGIDYSPASIAYAREEALAKKLECEYMEGDLREVPFGSGFDLVMFIYGELNVFKPQDARQILLKAFGALVSGGRLVLEVQTYAGVQDLGKAPATWTSSPGGLFSDRPHIQLQEGRWDEAAGVAIERYYILDGPGGTVTRYSSTTQAYTDDQWYTLLQACGYQEVVFYQSLEGQSKATHPNLMGISACKE